jgi:hypothetical protein
MPQMPASGGAGVYPFGKSNLSLHMATEQPLLRTMGVLSVVRGATVDALFATRVLNRARLVIQSATELA